MLMTLEDRYKSKFDVTLRQLQRQFNTNKMMNNDRSSIDSIISEKYQFQI